MLLSGGAAPAPPGSQPNVMLVILDDATYRDLTRSMSQIRGKVASANFSTVLNGPIVNQATYWTGGRPGITWYDQTFSEVSQCDPSRYSTFSGVRATRHLVTNNIKGNLFKWTNDGSGLQYGGLHTTFRAAGYRIGQIGKIDHQNLSAPKFACDYYCIPADNAVSTYHDYDTWENGVKVHYTGGNVQGVGEENFFCDVMGVGLPPLVRLEAGGTNANSRYNTLGGVVPSKFMEWMTICNTDTSVPWFLVWACENPHQPATTAVRYGGSSTDNPAGAWYPGNGNLLPTDPSFAAMMTNPPPWLNTVVGPQLPFSTSQQNGIRGTERSTERSLLPIDDQLKAMMDYVDIHYPNTLIVIMSDQGLAQGEHGLNITGTASKCDAYRAAARMILGIRLPNVTTGGPFYDNRLVSNLDICPTICAIAGVPLPRTPTDGFDIRTSTRSFLPIEWDGEGDGANVTAFKGVRRVTDMYLKYVDPATADYNFEELYDIGGTVGTADTFEMFNQAAAGGGYATLKATLAALVT